MSLWVGGMILLLVSPGLPHGAAFSWWLSWKAQGGPTHASGVGADSWLGHLGFPYVGLSSSSKLDCLLLGSGTHTFVISATFCS